jgi:hypothetical protein
MRIYKTLVICCIPIFISGCNKNDEYTLTGNIAGFVRLVDEFGNESEDKSGIKVSLDGVSNTTTSNIGRYEFQDVPAGTYKLIYEKPGYGPHKRFSYQFIGGNVPAFVDETALYEPPDIEVLGIETSFVNNRINISCTITAAQRYKLHIFFSKTPDVSDLNYSYSFYSSFCCGNRTQFFNSIDILHTPYVPGDRIYLVIYFFNYAR